MNYIMEKKQDRILSVYDICLIAGIVVTNIVYSVLSGTVDIIGSAAGIAGVACVVLVAKGSIWNYAFGLVNVTLYALISYKAALYGDAVLNALYYLPMQFVGWWQWRKRGAAVSRNSSPDPGRDVRVRARRMTPLQRAALAVGSAALYKDSATTVLSIIAQALMALAFMEQWALWIITNLISVVMWSVCVARGDEHAGLMVVMWVFYLLNSLNGLRVWFNLSKRHD